MDPAYDPSSIEAVAVRATNVTAISSSTHAEEGRFVPGTLLGGRYRIIALLDRGGMGEVYRVTSGALKFLPEEAAKDQRLLERFHGEVRVARQVPHANVCRVYDMGEAEGAPFLSMQYVDGEDLPSPLRLGLLAAFVAVVFVNTCGKIVVGSDWTAWYAPYGLATLALLLGIALVAFWRSLGSRELLGEGSAAKG